MMSYKIRTWTQLNTAYSELSQTTVNQLVKNAVAQKANGI